MDFGVKVIHTYMVGQDRLRLYEEIILKVNAESFDEAYEKAERHMKNCICEYKNINNETVKTLKIEAIDCFAAFDEENDVQEVFSSFSVNKTKLSEDDYYGAITSDCSVEDLCM